MREYLAHLFSKKKLKPGTVTPRLAALRFFYIQTLRKPWSIAETPYPKKVLRLPTILSQEEVARLIDAARTPHQRILLMTLYATGVRRGELAHLKLSDIDSQRMVIHVQGGKALRNGARGGGNRRPAIAGLRQGLAVDRCSAIVPVATQSESASQKGRGSSSRRKPRWPAPLLLKARFAQRG